MLGNVARNSCTDGRLLRSNEEVAATHGTYAIA